MRCELFQQMERVAKEERIPIMEPIGIETLLQMLRIQEPQTILEIGTAIGYSALRMADALPQTTVVTIEIDEKMVERAKVHIKKAQMEDRVIVLNGDALELFDQASAYGKYDAIFIDAAKGQYVKFFELYKKLLNERGCIYSDNVLFKSLVAKEATENKRLLGIAKKLNKYNEWLMNQADFYSTIIPAGDGIAVSKKL